MQDLYGILEMNSELLNDGNDGDGETHGILGTHIEHGGREEEINGAVASVLVLLEGTQSDEDLKTEERTQSREAMGEVLLAMLRVMRKAALEESLASRQTREGVVSQGR